jgi:hypothetical protein
MAERWQKDANGIIIFVSPHVRIHTLIRLRLEWCRPVYSLPSSPPYFQ